MFYQEFRPAPDLARYVDCYWRVRAHAGDRLHPVFPDGHSELVAHLAEPLLLADGSLQSSSVWVGQMRTSVLLRAAGTVDAFGVRFRPEGAWAFCRIPQWSLQGLIFPAEDVLGRHVRKWRDRLADAPDRTYVTNEFLRSCAANRDSDLALRHALTLLDDGASVESTAKALPCTPRHLERLFRERVGLTPKLFGRISRFQRALRSAREINGPELAFACGYADQAHLISDFREFTGVTPGRTEAYMSDLGASMSHLINTIEAG